MKSSPVILFNKVLLSSVNNTFLMTDEQVIYIYQLDR